MRRSPLSVQTARSPSRAHLTFLHSSACPDSASDTTLTSFSHRFNPGRIDPTNAAWDASRKPLVAAWETPSGARFFTVNLHLTAKLDGSSTQGNARPPINGGVDQRIAQVETIAVSVAVQV